MIPYGDADMVNAFEDPDKVPEFERIQREMSEERVIEIVKKALRDLPPDDNEMRGIKQNIDRLKSEGLWATARFYEKLLHERDLLEG